MMRRVRQSAPLSLAVFTAMFAFAAGAQEPPKPLPFEQFHGAGMFPNAGIEAAPEIDAREASGTGAGARSPAAGGHEANAETATAAKM